jgi:hypothetical protein
MDIDAARKKGTTPQFTCRRCGEPGHFARDCEKRFDIRHMSSDEIQTALENMLAGIDVAEAEQRAEETSELEESDFVRSSG